MRLRRKIRFTFFAAIALVLVAGVALAATKTFEREYTYIANQLDTLETSRAISLEQVKRILLEELGTYLISETIVSNFEITKDKVTILTAGVVSTNIVDEKWDGKTYWLKAQIKADPDAAARSINELRNDSQKIEELVEARRIAKEALAEIENLRAMVSKLEGKNQILEAKASYKKETDRLSATDWFERALAHQKAKRYTEAIEAYDKAIELKQEYAYAYNNRGLAYFALNQNEKAIANYNKSIELKPENFKAYNNMGLVYEALKQYEKAIVNYDKAIELKQEYAEAYSNRGIAYYFLRQYDMAIANYDKAISLNPEYFIAYGNRGFLYYDLKQYDMAIADFDKVISLNPGIPLFGLYYKNACIYSLKGDKARACKNLRTAVEKGYNNFSSIKQNSDLDNIRDSDCYKEIMEGK